MRNETKKSLWTWAIVGGAVRDSFVKLNPRTLMKNPVMFVVEIGSVITSYDLIRDRILHLQGFGFELQITLWLWFTVLFANFAEAMAEAAARRKRIRCARRVPRRRRVACAGMARKRLLPVPHCAPGTW